MIDNERAKLIDRLTKLLALAESTEHSAEAETARNMAAELMARHNIAAVKQDDPEPFVTDYRDRESNSWTEFCLRSDIAKLNGIYAVDWPGLDRYIFVGKPSDLEAFDFMVEIVLRQRTEAWLAYKNGGGVDNLRALKTGFMQGLSYKISQLMRASDDAQRNLGQLVPVSPFGLAEAWYLEGGNKVSHGRSSPRQSSAAGIEAGRNVSLNRGIGKESSGAPLRIGGR